MSAALATADTLGAALARGRTALRDAGIEPAALDARLLVAAAAGVPVETVIAYPERALPPGAAERLQGWLARRLAREPMAYILGRREFWSLDFVVTPATLTPRPDSETLVAAVLERIGDHQAPRRLLDFGTGTGCLLLALLSELPAASGIGVDSSDAALAVARGNAETLGLATRAVFVRGDWGAGLAGMFDIIISNPPYIATHQLAALPPEVRHEPQPALDGGADGLAAYRRLMSDVARLLARGGIAALEVGDGQAADVEALGVAAGLGVAGRVTDLAGIERCVLLRTKS